MPIKHPLSDLPPELILHIAKWLDYAYEINAFARTNRRFYALLDSLLYTKYSREEDQFALRWAASHGSELAVRKTLAAGAEPSTEAMLLAATFGHEDIVALLHEKGADIHAEGRTECPEDVDWEKINYDADCRGTPLVRAVIMGHEHIVRFLLDMGADPNCAVPAGYGQNTPIERAACSRNPSVMKLLIEAKRELRCPDLARQLQRCLYLAASSDDIPSVRVLIEAGASLTLDTPTMPRTGDSNPVDAAATNGGFEVTELLLQNGCRPTIWVLSSLLDQGKMEMIQFLMQRVDFPNLAEDDHSRATIFAAAAACGDLPLVKDLISKGWNVDGPPTRRIGWNGKAGFLLAHGANPFGSPVDDRDGLMGSLIAAVNGGNADIVSLLLDHGADPNTVNDGEHILFSTTRNEAVFKVLVERGADVNVRKRYHNNPISTCVVRYGTGDMVRLMRERGVDFDRPTFIPDGGDDRGEYNNSLLQLLAGGDISVVHALVEHGFDPRPDHPNACQALYAAVENANLPYLRFLLDRGFNPRALGVESNLLFHAAAIWCRGEEAASVLDFLLAEGLDLESLDESGETPLLQSVRETWFESPRPETVRLLLSRGANPIFQSRNGEYPLVVACTPPCWKAREILDELCKAIEAQKIPFYQVGAQLLGAIKRVELQKYDDELRILRKLYWRGRYPVD